MAYWNGRWVRVSLTDVPDSQLLAQGEAVLARAVLCFLWCYPIIFVDLLFTGCDAYICVFLMTQCLKALRVEDAKSGSISSTGFETTRAMPKENDEVR